MKSSEIPASEMRIGVRYVVTVSSKNKEFKIDDHIYLDKDGCIMCREAGGWIEAEDVPSATERMLVKVDCAFYEKELSSMNKSREDINLILGH